MSMNAFDVRLGLGNNYIGSMIRREANIGSDVLEKIVRNFTEINPTWLITGEGEMMKTRQAENFSFEDNTPQYEKDLFELTLLKYLDKPRIQDKIKNIMKDEEAEESDR